MKTSCRALFSVLPHDAQFRWPDVRWAVHPVGAGSGIRSLVPPQALPFFHKRQVKQSYSNQVELMHGLCFCRYSLIHLHVSLRTHTQLSNPSVTKKKQNNGSVFLRNGSLKPNLFWACLTAPAGVVHVTRTQCGAAVFTWMWQKEALAIVKD